MLHVPPLRPRVRVSPRAAIVANSPDLPQEQELVPTAAEHACAAARTGWQRRMQPQRSCSGAQAPIARRRVRPLAQIGGPLGPPEPQPP
eukprot:4553362-Prymnesium_polylepis.1